MLTDTAPDVQDLLVTMWRTAPSWQKLALVTEAIALADQLVAADVARRFPAASVAEQRYLRAVRWYGADFLAQMGVPAPLPERG